MAITKQEIAVLKKMFAKTRAKTDPLVVAKNNPNAPPYAKEMIGAQNVLRDCISVVFNECMPINEAFCAEMAIRLASYAISVVPAERQEAVAHVVAASLPGAHVDRMKQGVGIHSTWVTDGVEHTNVPEKGREN